MSGWFNSGWFGGGSARNAGPKDAILKLREQKDTLEKREAYIETQIREQEEKARKNATTAKNMALAALKKKKALEAELDRTQKHMAALETQISSIETANINFKTLEAMQEANKAMNALSKKYKPERIDKIMDEVEEHTSSVNYMGERISEMSQGNQIDDDELLAELEGMQQEELDNKILGIRAPVADPSGAGKQKQTAKEPEEEDEEAELRKLQAEMAM